MMNAQPTATQPKSAAGVTAALVTLARAIDYATLPGDAREIALQCALDWFAVTVAAAHQPLPSLLLDHALGEGGKPLSTIVARDVKIAPLQAALINGTASHMLDYDDVNLSMNGHPSAVLMPALLAAAEPLHATGADIVAAFVAGYETAARVGLLVAPGHYARGYHATATVGAVAAAAGCAHLMKLSADQMAVAIGIAATQAAGLKSMFGTECKPFHAGLAAQSGLRAAQLASRGMASRTDALECAQGFAATLSPNFNPEAVLGDPGKYYIRENLFKYHASCYGTHSALECVSKLRAAHGVKPQMVRRATVRVEKGADAVCNIQNPRTGLEAKFSVRFMTALGLAGMDTSDLAIYNEATAADPFVCALRDRVAVELVNGWTSMQTEVILELADGRRVVAMEDTGIPATDVAGQARRVTAKFERLVPPVLGAERSARLMSLLQRLGRVRADELMSAASLPAGA
jgi:2-methylcitrate dehydratase PrpD